MQSLSSNSQIGFVYDSEDSVYVERMQFWDSLRPWFLERGYTLYAHQYWRDDDGQIDSIDSTNPEMDSDGEVHFPYSFFGGDPTGSDIIPLSARVEVRPSHTSDLIRCSG